MYVAVGQFAVTPDWNENAEKCVSLMHAAKQKGGVVAGTSRGVTGP